MVARGQEASSALRFHNELGNFGIISGIWDKVFGTLYESPRDVPRSETTYNLGYAGAERDRHPWVAELSATEGECASRRARRTG
jgi:hypothetical protein